MGSRLGGLVLVLRGCDLLGKALRCEGGGCW